MSSTITDKNTFTVSIIDRERYNTLSQENKVFFEGIRNSILEIFPFVNGEYHELSIKFAENHAFIFIEKMNSILDDKIVALEKKLTETFQQKFDELKKDLYGTTTKV